MSDRDKVGRQSRRQGLRLVVLVAAMFGFGFALVPLYDALCRVTGLNGKVSGVAAEAGDHAVDESRLVKVQFVTTVNGGRTWEFRADQDEVQVHPGQLTTVSFHARNTLDQAVVGQAVPSIAPWNAARHMLKTECFCFDNQSFAAGEEKHMPVRFVVDRELAADVDTITLSYTFFDITETAQHDAAQSRR